MWTILHSRGDYFVKAERFGKTDGYAVYRNGLTHATCVASIGYSGDTGLKKAIAEANRRAEADDHV